MDKLLDLTRDFDAAKAAFEAYLDEYDRADDKIHLKIVHTYGVVDLVLNHGLAHISLT